MLMIEGTNESHDQEITTDISTELDQIKQEFSSGHFDASGIRNSADCQMLYEIQKMGLRHTLAAS